MRTVTNIGLIFAYVVTVPILGLFTSTGIYLTLHMLLLGIRPVAMALAIAAAAVAIVYGFFGLLLGVNVPGVIFF